MRSHRFNEDNIHDPFYNDIDICTLSNQFNALESVQVNIRGFVAITVYIFEACMHLGIFVILFELTVCLYFSLFSASIATILMYVQPPFP